MKLIVKPGQVVCFTTKIGSTETQQRRFSAIVQQVLPGALIVPEVASRNGLAQITCVGTSGTEGEYWYSYINTVNQAVSFNVSLMTNEEGDQIKTSSFIEQ